MVRPKHFGFNPQTAENNAFQNKIDGFTDEQIQDIALLEFDNMVSRLKSKGIKVIVFQDAGHTTPDSIFPNNWFSTFTDEIVLYPMFSENRRLERKEEIYKKLSNDLRKPINKNLLSNEKKGDIIEGTGSLVCDYASKTAFAALSERTTNKALDLFEKETGFSTVRFTSLGPDGNAIYHTNVMMTMGDTFAILGTSTILDEDKAKVVSKLQELGKEVIELSKGQVYDHFAGNMLQLQNTKGDKFLIMSQEAFYSLTPAQIISIEQDHKSEIISVPIHTIEKIGGGSARCMMAEVFYS